MRSVAIIILCAVSGHLWGQGLPHEINDSISSHITDTIYTGNPGVKTIKSPEISFTIGKASFKSNLSGRVQLRYDYSYNRNTGEIEKDFKVRRSRIKSKGHLFFKSLNYKFEYDIPSNTLLDMVLKWNMTENFSLWAGQTKLPGNRERVISSQDLQFVDRSLLNANFTLDRDLGIWMVYEKQYDQVFIVSTFSVSTGEGLRLFKKDLPPIGNGFDYTGRIEFFPMGKFEDDGAYFSADLVREQTPKLAVGVSYDYNNNANKSKGQLGEYLERSGDLESWIVDAMFKYKGFSYMGEFAHRVVGDMAVRSPDNTLDMPFYTGYALNNQIGYLFPYNIEVATRYTLVRPDDNTGWNHLDEYTVALSKYIIGHQIKIQTDASLQQEANADDEMIYRIQLELSF